MWFIVKNFLPALMYPKHPQTNSLCWKRRAYVFY